MANEIWYGDPGLEPEPNRGIMYWLGQKYRTGITPGMGAGTVDPGLYGGDTGPANIPVGFGGGELSDWVSPEQLARFRAGAGFAGTMGYDPVEEMRYMGLGVSQPNVGQFGLGGAPANVSTPVASDYGRYGLDRPPTDASTPKPVGYDPARNYPAAAYQARHGTGVGYQPPGQAPAGGEGGRFEFTYQNIRDLERGLKEAGYTGQTIYKDGDVIRRDGQGRIISITRGAGSRSEISPDRLGYQPSKYQRRRGYKNTWDRTGRDGVTNRNRYATPDWIKTMSNWRGI